MEKEQEKTQNVETTPIVEASPEAAPTPEPVATEAPKPEPTPEPKPEPTPEPTPEPADPTVGILEKIIVFIKHIIELITKKQGE